MNAKATKIDANTWEYSGFTINRWTTSRTFSAARPDGTKTYVRNTLREILTDIDFWKLKRRDIQDRSARAACEAGKPVACPDQHLCRHGINN